jgi:hypothetical protein
MLQAAKVCVNAQMEEERKTEANVIRVYFVWSFASLDIQLYDEVTNRLMTTVKSFVCYFSEVSLSSTQLHRTPTNTWKWWKYKDNVYFLKGIYVLLVFNDLDSVCICVCITPEILKPFQALFLIAWQANSSLKYSFRILFLIANLLILVQSSVCGFIFVGILWCDLVL